MAELNIPDKSTSIKLPGGLHRRLNAPSSTPSSSSPVLCGICAKTPFVYVCPRCNVKYCSRVCYQAEAHVTCSETFYRECCMQSLGEVATEDDKMDREKVAKLLKEDAEARADGDDRGRPTEEMELTQDLSDRVAELDLDNDEDLDKLWDRLTPAEKAEFESQLRTGEAAKWLFTRDGAEKDDDDDDDVIGIRTPWWYSPLVVDVDGTTIKRRLPPPIFSKIQPLSTITSVPPSSTIANNLVNILFAYVYCWRLYNGDHGESLESADEFLRDFVVICGVVNEEKKENFDSVAASLCSAVTRLGADNGGDEENRALFCSNDFTATAMEDVAALCVKGRENVARAVSDVRSTAKKAISKEGKTEMARRGKNKATKSAVKKLEYYLGWIAEYGDKDRLDGLTSSVRREALAYRKKIQSVKVQSALLRDEDE